MLTGWCREVSMNLSQSHAGGATQEEKAGDGEVRQGICSESPKLSAEKSGTAEAIP